MVSVFQDDAAHGTVGVVEGVEGKEVCYGDEVEYAGIVKCETGDEGVVEEDGASCKEKKEKKLNKTNSKKKLNKFF
ncbi:uncharacterized protein MONOS_4399 [Monocercomonoides exilis]|uniref:uncharacterized protein n=1 Tax=Monocercomonoides exilis TaxID=2049356 RepID=UPI00355AC141|nr:hypothetical protein MONOS_4399 [Monocercomonoides exilis]|eukprot:MONOS_4399.1-p1 / transcript=MONOS_4399.1 / gene=MONOS_4399 / organism=Monocercomonoides_exilis_PA203 / gene_product=unspecified product / transcript_product=unspecified product / location=Mono_scaffold00117:5754-5981(-) / protein_length=76 / sequence_SO=supercontig / SO=protein_coding / is_pseudo=false